MDKTELLLRENEKIEAMIHELQSAHLYDSEFSDYLESAQIHIAHKLNEVANMSCKNCKHYNYDSDKCSYWEIRIICPNEQSQLCERYLPIDGVDCKHCKNCQVWHGKENVETIVTIACALDNDPSEPTKCKDFEM